MQFGVLYFLRVTKHGKDDNKGLDANQAISQRREQFAEQIPVKQPHGAQGIRRGGGGASFVLSSYAMIGDDETRRTSTKGHTMAQAIMDPEKVRRFADELQRFNTDLENRLVMLQARFGALGDTWQDQEHEKFSEEFKLAMKALKKFVELSKAHTPYLLRKAQRIEEYLHQR
jgi:uncharacterized protein YukE